MRSELGLRSLLLLLLVTLAVTAVFAEEGNSTLTRKAYDVVRRQQEMTAQDPDGIKKIIVYGKPYKKADLLLSLGLGCPQTRTFTVQNVDPGHFPLWVYIVDCQEPPKYDKWEVPEEGACKLLESGTWTEPVEPVGGIYIPVDKFGLLAPYIGLASTIIGATVAAAIYVKRVKRRKEKQ